MAEGFPTTEPAMIALIDIHPAIPLGTTSSGYSLSLINIQSYTQPPTSASGAPPPPVRPADSTNTLTTLPTFSGPPLKAEIHSGADWITGDPGNKHIRLDVRLLAKTDDDAHIALSYTGICTINEENLPFITGQDGAKTTSFGALPVVISFQTGSEKYKYYEENKFVGSGRFIVKESKNLAVEYRISRVVS